MRKYIFTEEQIKKVIDNMINEQAIGDSSHSDENMEETSKDKDKI
jgi:hypothetical protein